LAQEASAAAARGDCATVGDLARRTSKIDPMFYEESFARDASISACLDQPLARDSSISGRVVVHQVAAGGLGTSMGLGAMMIVALGNLANCWDSDRSCHTSGFGWTAAVGLAAGAGAGAGVALTGNHRGSAGAAVLGGLFGGLAASFLQKESYPDSMNVALFALPTIGAMAGYYSFEF
jgi:hypothetical protein